MKLYNSGNNQIINSTSSSFFEDVQYRSKKKLYDNDKINKFYDFYLYNLKNNFYIKFNKKSILRLKNGFTYKIIELYDGVQLYLIEGFCWFIGDNDLKNIFEDLKKGNKIEFNSNLEDFYINLYNNGLLSIDGVFFEANEKKIDNIYGSTNFAYLGLTKRCNLNCKYCVANANSGKNLENDELSTTNLKIILDKIDVYLKSKNKKIEWILGITGGEPFLRKDLVDILEYSKDKIFTINITTNGTIISDDDIIRIKKIPNISFNFSIDGHNKDEHNKYRGKGNFEKTINNLKKLQGGNQKIFINSFLHRGNINTIEERLKLFKSLGIDGVNFLNSFKRGRDQESDFVNFNEGKLFNILYEICSRNEDYLDLLKNESRFASIITRIKVGSKINHTGIGINEPFFINYAGNLYVSPSLVGNQSYLLGNILEESIDNLMENDKIYFLKSLNIDTINKDCGTCNFRYFCGGENFGENLSLKGNLDSKHHFCLSRKNSIIEAFRIIYKNSTIYNDKVKEIIYYLNNK